MTTTERTEKAHDALHRAITAMYDENQALRSENVELKERVEKAWEIIQEYEDREFKWMKFTHWFKVHEWFLWSHIWNYISICIGRGGQQV